VVRRGIREEDVVSRKKFLKLGAVWVASAVALLLTACGGGGGEEGEDTGGGGGGGY
jgi:uncharacterized membrane protein